MSKPGQWTAPKATNANAIKILRMVRRGSRANFLAFALWRLTVAGGVLLWLLLSFNPPSFPTGLLGVVTGLSVLISKSLAIVLLALVSAPNAAKIATFYQRHF